jgi:TctA family transporter
VMVRLAVNLAFNLCAVLAFFGLVAYFLQIAAWLLPYTLGFVLGCLLVAAFIAWRRSNGS